MPNSPPGLLFDIFDRLIRTASRWRSLFLRSCPFSFPPLVPWARPFDTTPTFEGSLLCPSTCRFCTPSPLRKRGLLFLRLEGVLQLPVFCAPILPVTPILRQRSTTLPGPSVKNLSCSPLPVSVRRWPTPRLVRALTRDSSL